MSTKLSQMDDDQLITLVSNGRAFASNARKLLVARGWNTADIDVAVDPEADLDDRLAALARYGA